MNKFSSVFIPIVIVVVAVVVVVVILVIVGDDQKGDDPLFKGVEVITNPGTKVFAKLPEGMEQFINSVPELGQIKVDIPTNADVILRYDNLEEIVTYKKWQEENIIVVDFNNDTPPNTLISIEINAKPWAAIFIKLPEGDDFIKPRAQDFVIPPDPGELNTNFTPIRGGLQVPIGTTIKLVYEGREKVFSYETWKDNPRISYNF